MSREDTNVYRYVALFALVAFAVGSYRLGQPGLYYDELLFGNAATGCGNEGFANLKFHGIPILTMDYIGALKAWLYYPLFQWLPINECTIRMPALALGILGGVFLVLTARRLAGNIGAYLCAPVVLLDPTLVLHSRLDWGPDALMFLFRGLLVFALVSWSATGRLRWFWLALLAALLGTFDKLNFLWLAWGALGASLLAQRQAWKTSFSERRPAFWIASGLLVALLAAFTLRAVMLSAAMNEGAQAWGHRLGEAWFLLRLAVCGGGALNFVSGDGLRYETWMLAFLGVGIPVLLLALSNGSAARLRSLSFPLLFSMLATGAFVVTKAATGPHHSAALGALVPWILATSIALAMGPQPRLPGTILAFAWALSTGLLFATLDMRSIQDMARPANRNWDQAHTSLVTFAASQTGVRFLTTDWGLGTQLVLGSRGRNIVDDNWPALANPADAEAKFRALRKGDTVIVVGHTEASANAKGLLSRALATAASVGAEAKIIAEFKTQDGTSVIEMRKLEWQIVAAGTAQGATTR